MDRRSWLWRRKSLEKSPGAETESTGSVSSLSERFFDDQVCPTITTHGTQSPEVICKESVKTLKDNLSSALLEIIAKDDQVKQHSKVAEEAVSGWEKAELEVSGLKKKNFALEDRLGHLDQALKECVRQLRQAREDQELKILEAVAKKTLECESLKSEFESQLVDLRAAKDNALSLIENENSTLKLELSSRAKELEICMLERDLSVRGAETVSKQHLESIRKVSKLEAECRRLNALARKASRINDQNSLDGQSDCGERVLAIDPNEKKNKIESSLIEISLMDDFLEMERLASLPDSDRSNSTSEESQWRSDLEGKLEKTEREKVGLEIQLEESRSRLLEAESELQELRNRLLLAEEATRKVDNSSNEENRWRPVLERKLEKTEREKVGLEIKLDKSHSQLLEAEGELQELRNQLFLAVEAKRKVDNYSNCWRSELEGKLEKTEREREGLEIQLDESKSRLLEAENELQELRIRMFLADEAKRKVDEKVEAVERKRESVESQLRVVENEVKTLLRRVGFLEEEVTKERVFSAENLANCKKLEDEVLRMKLEAENQKVAEVRTKFEIELFQEKELAYAAEKFAQCQKTIASLGQQLKCLANLEDFLMDSDN